MSKAQVVMADVFGKYYDKLDGSVQAQVLQFIMKMQRDPDANGLNLKPPKGAEDKRVRTARINDNFRAVLMHYADRIYYLVAVLPHDDAYTLASHIIFDINKVTGGKANEGGRLALSAAMMQTFGSFAKTGNPNSAGLGIDWQPWPQRARFGATLTDKTISMQ